MFTRPTSRNELKEIFAEILFNKTDKVTKVSNNSVLNGIAYGVAAVGQKALKDIALIESHLFPDDAFDTYLDDIADKLGISARFGPSQSSTFLRLVGSKGTLYQKGIHTFTGSSGITFDMEEDVIIGDVGFAYTKVRSQDIGKIANVDPLTINKVTPVPAGHSFCINEYVGTGGRDLEQDDVFRKRIKEGANILARGTIAMITQVFMKINPNILRVFYQGVNSKGQVVLAIVTQNGIDLNGAELDALLDRGQEFFALTELKPVGRQSYGIQLTNIDYQAINISFRCELLPSYNPDEVRKNIQVRISKALDFRFWDSATQKVEWDDLLQIVKTTQGVKYVPDTYFFPSSDITIDKNKLPRIQGFLMLSLTGDIISNITGTLSPVFYPNNPSFTFTSTVLSTI